MLRCVFRNFVRISGDYSVGRGAAILTNIGSLRAPVPGPPGSPCRAGGRIVEISFFLFFFIFVLVVTTDDRRRRSERAHRLPITITYSTVELLSITSSWMLLNSFPEVLKIEPGLNWAEKLKIKLKFHLKVKLIKLFNSTHFFPINYLDLLNPIPPRGT